MATDITYTPDSIITKAMFNFDAFGLLISVQNLPGFWVKQR